MKKNTQSLSIISLMMAFWLCSTVGAFADPVLDVVKTTKMSKKRVGRFTEKYTMAATIENYGDKAAIGTGCRAISLNAATVIGDDVLFFGNVHVGEHAESINTFSFTHDRRKPFNPAAITFECMYEDAPLAIDVVGAEGKTLEVTDDDSNLYGLQLIIPEGALSQDETITIREGEEPDIPLPEGLSSMVSGVVMDFGRDGIVFEKPVLVSFHYEPGELNAGESVGVAYFNEEIQEWNLLPPFMIDPENERVFFYTDHFSIYESVKVALNDSTVQTSFNILDSLSFRNDAATLTDIGCVGDDGTAGGVCHDIASVAKWYFDNHDSPALHCLYDKQTAARLACDIHNHHQSWWDITKDFLGMAVDGSLSPVEEAAFDNIFTKQYMIHKLRQDRPVLLNIFGRIHGDSCYNALGCGHALLVTGWTRLSSTTGYFTVYDVNDNTRARRLYYTTEGIALLRGTFRYNDHLFGDDTSFTAFIVGKPLDVDFNSYLQDQDKYPRQDDPAACVMSNLTVNLTLPENGTIYLNAQNTLVHSWDAIHHPDSDADISYCLVVNDRGADLESTDDDASAYDTCTSGRSEFELFPSTSYTLPAGTLVNDRDYTWTVFAVDDDGNFSQVQWYNFSTGVWVMPVLV